MADNFTNWRSPDGQDNAVALQAQFAEGFHVISEFDRIGYLLLHRAGQAGPVQEMEQIVGLAMLRRSITIFAGIRRLLEQSLADPAKALARAYFELWLQHRCLAYGSQQPIALETATVAVAREPRARRYYVAAERRGLRARALILSPDSPFPPKSSDQRESLHRELLGEIARLRTDYPAEWNYFGDVTETSVIRHVGGRNEPQWFAAEFHPRRVNSMAKLAGAYGLAWEYDFLYDAFSALVHSRGIGHDVTIEGKALAVHHPHDPTWFEIIAYFVLGWHSMFLMTAAKWHSADMIGQLQQLRLRHRSAIESLKPTKMPDLLA